MSATHFWFGALALKSRSSRFGATGRQWRESVVRTKRRRRRACKPSRSISRRTRL
ncbi:hypothetical protein [Aromatoleum anaerobium]|uniref:hypothetical protein n=1 Tax=Aromatoleum anaerobium TaxID=182180 RepID=UPI001FF167B5|nr:hypothetical protein [Aromatoleum anaerobium]MCK0507616.1 hypothetical protein [Aromatoleum anaerobium]